MTFFRRFECVNVDSKLSNYVRNAYRRTTNHNVCNLCVPLLFGNFAFFSSTDWVIHVDSVMATGLSNARSRPSGIEVSRRLSHILSILIFVDVRLLVVLGSLHCAFV